MLALVKYVPLMGQLIHFEKSMDEQSDTFKFGQSEDQLLRKIFFGVGEV